MNTYYMVFNVSPTKENKHCEMVKGALAHCWVLDSNPVNAYMKARFHVSRYDW